MRRDCKIITPDLLMPNAILRQLYDRRSKRSLKSHATCCMYAFELERVSLSSSPARMEPIKWQWQLELTRAFNRNRVASEGNKGITWDCNIASGGRRIEVHWVYIFETKKWLWFAGQLTICLPLWIYHLFSRTLTIYNQGLINSLFFWKRNYVIYKKGQQASSVQD